ncbi:MAG: Stp1/IreP family PP2C-type Ser/Thr phosphatase [Clostridia bacterium]|nr:Stp1/IreP family PP2C-type Ser/Thr phosphatase [Clostridia bacterium]
MIISSKSDLGRKREENQDAYAAGELAGGAVYALVCDGMGGAQAGALASSTAVKTMRERLLSAYRAGMSDLSIKSLLVSTIELANKEIYALSLSDQANEGMGTTAVAVIVNDDYAFIAHAGDSRAYRIADGVPIQLTRDHSVVQRMVENGEITPEEAVTHPQKHIITSALGVENTPKIDFCQEPLEDGELLLICTDGLTNYTTPADLVNCTSDGEYHRYCDRLVELANSNGGGDNITVVIIEK